MSSVIKGLKCIPPGSALCNFDFRLLDLIKCFQQARVHDRCLKQHLLKLMFQACILQVSITYNN